MPDFLAEILHESGHLEHMTENLNYSADRIRQIGATFKPGTRWARAVPIADQLARNPEAFAEHMYGGRYGNDEPGDGFRYRGRTPVQLTFKDNYARVGNIVGLDLVGDPDQAAEPRGGLIIAIAWWEDKVPDEMVHNEALVRRVVNGGQIGLPQVTALYNNLSNILPEFTS